MCASRRPALRKYYSHILPESVLPYAARRGTRVPNTRRRVRQRQCVIGTSRAESHAQSRSFLLVVARATRAHGGVGEVTSVVCKETGGTAELSPHIMIVYVVT